MATYRDQQDVVDAILDAGQYRGTRRYDGQKMKIHCLAHSDSNESAWVSWKPGGKINYQCAVCDSNGLVRSVCEAIGAEPKMLYPDYDFGAGVVVRQAKATAPAGGAKAKKPKEPEAPIDWDIPPIYYEYSSLDGAQRGRKERRTRTDGKKAILGWKYLVGGEWKKPSEIGDGWVTPPMNLYRHKSLPDAIRRGETVYVVEGEKDVDNMVVGFGATAVSGPNGADNVASKWLPEYTSQLKGANVVLLGDNDDVGRAYQQAVAGKLRKVVNSLRVVELRKGWLSIPEHGDISDMIEALGPDMAWSTVQQLVGNARDLCAPADEREEIINIVEGTEGGFLVVDGCFARRGRSGSINKLCNFLAYPAELVEIHDGRMITGGELRVRGWLSSGVRLPDIVVPSAEFPAMRWVEQGAWQLRAYVASGNAPKDQLREILSCIGTEKTKRSMRYTHTGWRVDVPGAEACYLYDGGAVNGPENIDVQLGRERDDLGRYDLSAIDDDLTIQQGFGAIDMMRGLYENRVLWPMISVAFLAPMTSALEAANKRISFVPYIEGKTGGGKSALSTFILNFFARYGRDNFPATFRSTANAITSLGYILKDSLLVLDDYKPQGSKNKREEMASIAENVIVAYTDSAARKRSDSNGVYRGGYVPRGMLLMSGEQLPDKGESTIGRLYVIHLKELTMDQRQEKSTLFNELSAMVYRGALRIVMRAYIKWLAPQIMDGRRMGLDVKMERYEAMAQRELSKLKARAHTRAPQAFAHLMLGAEMFLRFRRDVLGDMTDDQLNEEIRQAWAGIMENAIAQAESGADRKPTKRYLDAIGDLIMSGAVKIVDKNMVGGENGSSGRGDIAGYRQDGVYYFLKEMIYAKVQEMLGKSGGGIELTRETLQRQLKE